MKETIRLLLYGLIMFLVVYNPPIKAGLSFTTIAVLASFLVCLFYNKEFTKVVKTSRVNTIIKLTAAFIGYDILISIVSYLGSGDELVLSSLTGDLVSQISICLLPVAIVILALRREWSLDRLFLIYVIAGLYQSILGVICLLSPPVKAYFTRLIIANSSSDKIRSAAENLFAVRNFGFASSLFDIFGMAMSVLAVMAIVMGLRGNKRYFLIAALITFAAVINSRTSFILIAIGATIMFLSHSSKKVSGGWIISRIVLFSALIAGVGSLFTWLLDNTTTEQLEWLATALTDSQSLLEGEEVGYYDTLSNSYIFFPENILGFVFGTGLTPADAIHRNSDVGYIQGIWKYGIIGSVLQYIIFIKLFRFSQIGQPWPYKSFVFALAVMVAIYLIKLTCLGYSMASVIFVPICLYMIVLNESENKAQYTDCQYDN